MNKKNLWIVSIILLWVLLSFVLPMRFWANVASVLALPFLAAFDLTFYILPVVLILLIGLTIYTMVTKNIKTNLYLVLYGLTIIGFAGVRFDILFRSTSFFKLPEFLTLYFIILVILSAVALLAWVSLKKEVRYYYLLFGLLLLYLVLEFIGFYGI